MDRLAELEAFAAGRREAPGLGHGRERFELCQTVHQGYRSGKNCFLMGNSIWQYCTILNPAADAMLGA